MTHRAVRQPHAATDCQQGLTGSIVRPDLLVEDKTTRPAFVTDGGLGSATGKSPDAPGRHPAGRGHGRQVLQGAMDGCQPALGHLPDIH